MGNMVSSFGLRQKQIHIKRHVIVVNLEEIKESITKGEGK
jgi:hypothetical protein